ncbi:MAG: aldo/keto reductase [Bacilli bacterium]
MKQPEIKLSNGIMIPAVGFGTWQIPDGNEAYNAVKHALKVGYRHIDTAMAYKNEESVGRAIKDSKIPRNEIFITTKLPAYIKGYQETIDAFNNSLKLLNVEYIDLYLIHAPKPWGVEGDGMDYMEANIATWKAFEKLYNEGLIKSIGVSNFQPMHLEALMKETKIVPMVNQISVNPNFIPRENILFNQKHNILIEAYSPLATGRVFQSDRFDDMAKKYNKTVAQLLIRWSLQMGFSPLPKSVTPSRIEENFSIFDFEISEEDMDTIGKL